MNQQDPPHHLTYVYAAAHPTDTLRDALTGLHGIGGAPVRLLTAAPPTGHTATLTPLAFATSHVPATEFNEHDLKKHFEDLDWLEQAARAHHDVVQAIAAHTTVLPLRMATVYQDDDGARHVLAEQHTAFRARLAELAGHTEYGVKLYLATAPSTEPEPNTAPTTPGKAYLQRRRAQHHVMESRYQQAQDAAAALEATAARYAAQRARHPVQNNALASSENLLNDAYLIPDDLAHEFTTAMEDTARTFTAVRVEVTGPWAPYSFASPPSADTRTPPHHRAGPA
ncbi:GvpL/GvpF family gas vesicle protein [Streptomyces sp. NPDC008265]|uniref:GvpL/GvpF family gas vesicle protein n=1 Tax=Streptomyces sp. NPDC008265 TaxID=3364824 RepID=UPI0036E19730